MSLKIIQGEDRDITVQLKDGDGANLDLTQYASGTGNITACFVSTGAAITADRIATTIVINGSNDCGNITISLTDAQTALLDTSSKDFEIDLLDKDTPFKIRIVQLKGVLDIKEQIC